MKLNINNSKEEIIMSSIVADLFRAKMNTLKDPRMKKESEPDHAYPTGFLTFDYINGTVVHVKKDDMQFSYNSIGIVDGSMVTVIGRSSSGKTTWCVQTAGNIIRPFKSSCIWMDSVEGGIVDTRAQSLLKLYGKDFEDRWIPRNTGVTAENFYQRIKYVHDLKLEAEDKITYDTGTYTQDGEKIYKMEPSVYILDSLAMLTPGKLTEEEELSGQMSVTSSAKMNTMVFKRIIPMLKAANIILFVVNHITEDVQITPFSRTQGQLSYLKPGERLGGGRAAIYVTNLLVRLDDHSKMKSDEGLGIDGSLVDFTLLKSRTAAVGQKTTLVFNYNVGFDPDLSLYYFLKSRKLINGAGIGLYIGDRNDLKFSQKNLKTKLQENEEFRNVFVQYCLQELQTLIHDPIKEEQNNTFDITASILSQINESVA